MSAGVSEDGKGDAALSVREIQACIGWADAEGASGAADDAERELSALLAEVERLTRDNDLQDACLQSLEDIMFEFDSKKGKSRDELESRAEALVAKEALVERLTGERDEAMRDAVVNWELATVAEVEVGRLSGLVAAKDSALRVIANTPYRDWHKNAKTARAALAALLGEGER